jgi:hypothetical protein
MSLFSYTTKPSIFFSTINLHCKSQNHHHRIGGLIKQMVPHRLGVFSRHKIAEKKAKVKSKKAKEGKLRCFKSFADKSRTKYQRILAILGVM